MKRITLISAFMLLVFAFVIGQTSTVNLTSQKQVIKGFGGINHPVWYGDLNASERDLCFGNGAGQMGLTVLRIWVSDNKSQWSLELATAKKAIEHGAIVFATPWNPPVSMTMKDASGKKSINPAYYADYARHLNDFVLYMRTNGVELYAISVQNEPDYAEEWTKWTPQQGVDFIKGHADIIDCRLMTPESFQYRKDLYNPILNDPAALAKVSIFGVHLYGTAVSDFPYPLFKQKGAGKELWMTEVYTDSKSDANIWSLAMDAAVHVHNALVEGEFQTYVWWPLRRYYAFIHDGEGNHNNSTVAAAGTVTKRGYCIAQYSKFVRPGYVRVDATKSPAANVYVSAYKKGDDVVVVAINKTNSAQTVTVSIPGNKVATWERYVTSATKNVAKEANIIASGETIKIVLEPQSVVTCDGKSLAGSPTVSITSPKTNTSFTAPASIDIAASASDSDGTVMSVAFYNGTKLLGEVKKAPFSYTWSSVAAGSYTITAVATDNSGNKTTSAAVDVKVNVPQSPYGGVPSAIPGKIECEAFDLGGNGSAYSDNTPGSEVTPVVNFRTDEDVDIEVCTDAGGGYNIGYTIAGEWLEYTVAVASAGKYDISIRAAANGDDRTVSLSSNGKALATDIAIPNTGGWQDWQTVTVKNVELAAGEQVLRLTIGAVDYVNLNYITFTAVDVPPVKTMHLHAGWNLIGCPVVGETDVAKVLSSIWPQVTAVKNIDKFMISGNAPALNTLTKLVWGEGYYVHVKAACDLDWIVR